MLIATMSSLPDAMPCAATALAEERYVQRDLMRNGVTNGLQNWAISIPASQEQRYPKWPTLQVHMTQSSSLATHMP